MLKDTDIKEISNVLKDLISGSEITRMLQVLGMHDMDANKEHNALGSSKWIRIANAVVEHQRRFNNNAGLIRIVEYVFNPSRHINNLEKNWHEARTAANRILQFNGLMVTDSGKVVSIKKTETFAEGNKRFQSLRLRLENLSIHGELLGFCRPEILDKNYFSLIFEASKTVLNKVRGISGLSDDGNALIEKAFNEDRGPIIVLNKLVTDTEKSEYRGLKSLLKTIVYLYRNPKAHELRAFSVDSEDDAIAALVLISQAHKLLDRCGRNCNAPM